MTIFSKPHFVLVPLLAQGHMIPMVDMARLLAARGATVSFITTPVNASRMKPIIDAINESQLPIHFISLPFPSAEVGLPDGLENVDLLSSPETFRPFFDAMFLLRGPLLHYLQNQKNPIPTCIISDFCHPWTMQVAQVLHIPRFIFHGPCCLYLLGSHNIAQHGIYESVTDVNEPFVVPDLLPYEFKATKAQVPGFLRSTGWDDIQSAATEAETTCDGVLVNTFDELEPMFIEKYGGGIQKPVWAIGPMSLCNKDVTSKATRGSKACIDEHRVIEWLDLMKAKSVIFINFGSLVRTRPKQLMELGSGVEASGYPFIWVLKQIQLTEQVNEWLECFEERTKERGLVIKGWAPQAVILSHPAVGGFVTHCGWNSTLEAIAAGVPMITWPHFADQFLNEKLVVEVLRVGITLGVTMPHVLGFESEEVVVTRDDIKEAIVRLIDGGKEGEEIREKANEYGNMARKAMDKGGSSYENLGSFINYASQKMHNPQKVSYLASKEILNNKSSNVEDLR